MAFCTQCGHKNPDTAQFCEQCGNPLKKAATAAPPPVQAAAPAAPSVQATPIAAGSGRPAGGGRRLALFAVGTLLTLLIVAGGLYFAFSPETASKENFTRVIEQALQAHPDSYQNRYCLANFAYDQDPVYVSPNAANTQQWLKLLTTAGLYSEPESVTTSNGYFSETRLRYSKTDAGRQATRNGRLCFADGVKVSEVVSFTPPREIGNSSFSSATVRFAYRNPMPWTQSAEARSMVPALGQDFEETIQLVLKDRKWTIANADDVRQAMQLSMTPSAEPMRRTAPAAGGLFDKFKSLFSFMSGNPVLGKWTTNMMGMKTLSIEFLPDAMRDENGRLSKVRYQVDGHQVKVFSLEGKTDVLVIQVVDANHLSINAGLMNLQLTRAE
jgi:hypothetical protein